MKAKTPKKSVRNAHMLLAAYWAYKVLSGGNVLKTTINVLAMDRQSVANEMRMIKAEEAKERKAGKKAPKASAALVSSKAAGSSEAPVETKTAKASAGSAVHGVVRSAAFKRTAKSLLRSARVI